ncbi:alanine--tRNA ligase [Patescibacteria group bacterium]|nr:alanine--tRNA ligase [Patescibacteria group bacterium]
MLTSQQIREKYLNFFQAKQHAIIASSSLVPENDPSLLFINSGMSPLIPYLMGERHPNGNRLANSQKCCRTEDINEVGDNRHNTFFEMLGNWSLGDYYKKEQLDWWYELLIEEFKIDPSRLYQTIYLGDEKLKIERDSESINTLINIFGKYSVEANIGPDTDGKGEIGPGREIDFQNERIFAYRDKNWWQRGDAIGELGGPDSETFYDTKKNHDKKFGEFCHVNCDCGRFIEIGNSVFMQYQKTANGWTELPNKNVDFGGGLERISMVVQGKNNVFETDLFINTLTKIEELSDKKYIDYQREFEIISDHLKSAVFIIGDERGIVPTNTDQGYIVRRLIRRAIRFARNLEIKKDSWIALVAEIIINDYNNIYAELSKNKNKIIDEFNKEEAKFKTTLEKGIIEYKKIKSQDSKIISGTEAFNLYQTYGFPLEMTEELAMEDGLTLNIEEFEEELKKHQILSRTSSEAKFKGGLADTNIETAKLHTATHLMLSALKQVLGNHIEQKGSNITGERLRFDFSHPEKLTPEQLIKIESIVNRAINAKAQINVVELSVEDAKEQGAIGVFELKYDEKVKVYTIESEKEVFSKEICGGPHANNTEDLGHFKIVKEESSSAGVRRIKAILKNTLDTQK